MTCKAFITLYLKFHPLCSVDPSQPCRDHAGGNEEMAKRIPGIRIVGGVHDKVAAATEQVADRQQISVGSISIECIETPFHTQGHICYLCSEEGSSEKLIFTGDTLFIGGCGRFEAPQQHALPYVQTISNSSYALPG